MTCLSGISGDDHWLLFSSVGRLEDVEKIAKVTNCLKLYIVKGIALGCFVYARCLYKGYGVEKNEESATHWFKRVSYAHCTSIFCLFASVM